MHLGRGERKPKRKGDIRKEGEKGAGPAVEEERQKGSEDSGERKGEKVQFCQKKSRGERVSSEG